MISKQSESARERVEWRELDKARERVKEIESAREADAPLTSPLGYYNKDAKPVKMRAGRETQCLSNLHAL